MQRAREQAEELVREAYAEGMRRGMEAGQKEFDESVSAAAKVLEHVAAELQRVRQEFIDSLAPDISDLVAAVAQRVVRRELTVDPDVLRSTIHAALEKLYDQERVTLRVHPGDLDAMREQRVGFLEEFKGIEHLEIVPCEEVSPGGCIAESTRMYLDARLDTQLERILSALED